ncbi:hypothetical protein CAAN3_03S08460 [[Candida] anglica]
MIKRLIFLVSILSVVHAILPGIGDEDTLTQKKLVSCERIKYDAEGPYDAQVRATLITMPVKDVPIPIVIVRYADIDNIEGFPLATSEDLAKGEEIVKYKNILYRDRSVFNITLVDETRPTEYLTSAFTAKDQEIVFNATHSGTYCVYISKGRIWRDIEVELQFRSSHGYRQFLAYSQLQLMPFDVLSDLILLLIVYFLMPEPPKTYLIIQLGCEALMDLLEYAKQSNANQYSDRPLMSYWYLLFIFNIVKGLVLQTEIFFSLGLWTVHGWNFNAIPFNLRRNALIYVGTFSFAISIMDIAKSNDHMFESIWYALLLGIMSIFVLLSPVIKPMIILSFYNKTKLLFANTPKRWITGGIGSTLLVETSFYWGSEVWDAVQYMLEPSQNNSQDIIEQLQAVVDADLKYFEPLDTVSEVGKSILMKLGRFIAIYLIWRNINLKKEKK